MKKKYIIVSLIIIGLVLLDQISKFIVVNNFSLGESLILIKNFLKFTYIRNTGISFGILSNQVFLIVVFTLMIIVFVIKELINNRNQKLIVVSSILILSGAFGNLIDRVFRGYVIDFISFTLFKREMAIFNIADIFITFGVLLYIYIIVMEGKNERISSRRKR